MKTSINHSSSLRRMIKETLGIPDLEASSLPIRETQFTHQALT
jgi:hypothetical protein